MKLSDIQSGKKYYKFSASQKRKRGCKGDKVQDTIYVMAVDQLNKRVLASINQLPAQWHPSAVYAKWVADRHQNESK